jgi:3-dehydroquinate dehydratase / shikimate dehydrogenase
MPGFDKICAVVADSDARSMRRQLAHALRLTGTVELRLDWLASDSELGADSGADAEISLFLKHVASLNSRATNSRTTKPRPILIATCRRVAAGGRYRGTVAQQLVHLAEAIRAGCAWYDLEIETARQCPQELLDVTLGEGRRLTSAHFFRGMPPNLDPVGRELLRTQPDAIKIAAQCDSFADCRKLLRFARSRRPVVAMPMGEITLPARLLAIRAGSAFAYAAVENATAPGQISLDLMKNVYRAEKIDARTRVYGVIGDPIVHSLSPQMHNAAFAARRIHAIYLPFLVPSAKSSLKDFVRSIGDFGIRGFSVTIPHKQSILPFLDGCDPLAKKIGTVNTVVVGAGGKLHGYNTDYVGVLRTLEKRMPLAASRVLIVGAGGAARAVAFALAHSGAAVFIYARRPTQARALARAAGAQPMERATLHRKFFDAIVNATPVGMHPHVDQSPLNARELNCRLVFDTIYRPRITKLMRLARQRGIEAVSGEEMFLAQGAAQFEIFTGQPAPLPAMRRAVIRALAADEKAGEQGVRRPAPLRHNAHAAPSRAPQKLNARKLNTDR